MAIEKIYSSTMNVLEDTIKNHDLFIVYNLNCEFYYDLYCDTNIPVIRINSYEAFNFEDINILYKLIQSWAKKYYKVLMDEFYKNYNGYPEYPIYIEIYKHESLSEVPLSIKVLDDTIYLESFM